MAFGTDTKSRILLEFKADTRDAERGIKRVRGEHQRLEKSVADSAGRQSKSFATVGAAVGKVAIGLAAVVGTYKTLSAAADEYAKRSQLMGAAAGADIRGIQNATKGLITETQALSFAAAALNTDFKLNQQQMQEVAKFMIVLRNQGNDLSEVYREVTKAVVEGNAEGLKKFGVVIQGVKPGLEAHRAIMARIAEENTKAGDAILRAGDQAAITANAMKDAGDRFQSELGRTLDSKPVQGLLHTLELAAKGFNDTFGPEALLEGHERREQLIGQLKGMETALAILRSRKERGIVPWDHDQRVRFTETLHRIRTIKEELAGLPGILGESALAARAFASELGAAVRTDLSKLVGGIQERAAAERERRRAAFQALPDRQFGTELAGANAGFGSSISGPIGTMGAGAIPAEHLSADGIGRILDMSKQLNETLAEAKLAEQMASITAAAQTFANVGSAAFAQWASGAKSMGEALKDLVGNTLVGLATEMASRALFHGAAAIGALAIGGPIAGLSAAAHGKAAALYGAGAIAVGAAARAYSGATGGAPAGAGAGSSLPAAARGASPGASAQQGSNQTFIVVQSPFDDNRIEAQRRMRRAMDRANRSGSTSGAIIRE